jgi:hypothetical protein
VAFAEGEGSGAGNGVVSLRIESNSGPARSATLTVAGQPLTISQPAAPSSSCTFALNPTDHSAPAAGGDTTVSVSTQAGCSWGTSSLPSWIAVSSGAGNGTGSGTVTLSVQSNTGGARTAHVSIANQTFTVNQAAAPPPVQCSYTLNPTSHTATAAGGQTAVAVTAAAGCPWSTSGLPGWIAFSSGNGPGTGGGTVNLTIQANSGAARSATLQIAGHPFVVNQAAGAATSCTYSLNPTAFAASALGANVSVAVTAPAGCQWTTTGLPGWITFASGSGSGNGAGDGTVNLAIQVNLGGARSATLTIGGQPFTVTQAALVGCAYVVSPATFDVTGDAHTGQSALRITVQTPVTCLWTAAVTSGGSWLSIRSLPTGLGNGTVLVDVEQNDGGPRVGTLTVGGQTITINQARK